MTQRFRIVLSVLATSLLLLTGCGSRETAPPTLADEMRGAAADIREEADRRAQLADDWERGQNLITTGQRKIDRGERRIDEAESELQRGRREVQEGEAELSEGRRLVAESERLFEALRQQEMQSPQSPVR